MAVRSHVGRDDDAVGATRISSARRRVDAVALPAAIVRALITSRITQSARPARIASAGAVDPALDVLAGAVAIAVVLTAAGGAPFLLYEGHRLSRMSREPIHRA